MSAAVPPATTLARPGDRSAVPEERTIREATLRGIRATGIVVWGLVMALAVLPTYPRVDDFHGQLPMGILTLSLLMALAGLVFDLRNRAAVYTTAVMLLTACVMLSPHRFQLGTEDMWAPGYWALPWMAWALMTLSRKEYLGYALVAAPVLAGVDLALMYHHQLPVTRITVAPTIWIVHPVVLITLFSDGLLQLANRNDALIEGRRAAQQHRAQVRMREDARNESARLMHDHVLHALHALASVGERASQEMVRQECRDAVEAISGSARGTATARIEQLLREDSLTARTGAIIEGHTEPAPHAAAQAIAAAAHEALNNVSKHAQAQHCWVQVTQQDRSWRVEISDDGRGFDPAKVTRSRLGLRRSVVERMEEVGGVAEVRSVAGQGTRVSLVWPRPAGTGGSELLSSSANRSVRRVLLRTAWPGLLAGLLMTALMAPLMDYPRWATALALYTLGIGFIHVVKLRYREIGRMCVFMLCTAAVIGWTMNLVLAPDNPNLYHLWMAWAGSAVLHIVVLQIAPRAGQAVVAGWLTVQVAGLYLRYGSAMKPFMALSVVGPTAGEVAVALFSLSVARRIARHFMVQQSLLDQAREEAVRVQLSGHFEEFWSQQTTLEALPLLQAVADGSRRPDDPEVLRQARELQVALREELLLGPGETRLLSTLSALRRDGWTVQSTLTSDGVDRGFDHFAAQLQGLGPAAFPGQQLTLSATGEVSVAVALSPSPEQLARWRALHESPTRQLSLDEDFMRMRVLPVVAAEATPA